MISIEAVKSKLDYDKDTGLFTWKKGNGLRAKGEVAGQVSGWGYIRISLSRKKYSAHQLAWLLTYGEWPENQIDHRDGNKRNNAISNLRLATPCLNQLYNNRPRRNNSTGFVGISPDRGRFKAQLKINGKCHYLGNFSTAEEAAKAYAEAKSIAIKRLESSCAIGGQS
jgi:hypothetical protein